MIADVAAVLGDATGLVVADGGQSVEEVIAAVRAARGGEGGSVLVLISGDVPAVIRPRLHAMLAPLAVELAPGCRLNALDVAHDAAPADVAAAARFLAVAGSTTGQLIEVR